MAKENESIAMVQVQNEKNVPINCFGTLAGFEAGQRIANMFSQSNLVPSNFKGDIGGCLIALNMANRMGADPLQVMQSLYIVHGKPSFSSAFLIACFNRCGRYSTLRYRMEGEKGTDQWSCTAYTTELATGELIEGVTVSIAMAKAEGWYGKSGSKWQTMPELMLRYRAATFLIRSVAPEIALGFQTTEEVIDITDQAKVYENTGTATTLAEVAKQAIAQQAQADEKPQLEAEVLETPDVAEEKTEGGDFTSRYFKEHKKDEHEG